jgi:hypothetical protein
MDRVYAAEQKPLPQIGRVAIAIGTVGPNRRHIGVLHREGDAGQVLMLHLRWHHRLTNGASEPHFLWIDPAVIPRQRQIQVAAICRHIWRAHQSDGIPYGFSPPNDCFDEHTFRYLLGPTRHGLTCATFVLAVFHRAGIQLVEYTSWPTDRPGDAEWQAHMVNELERTGATPEHTEAVRSDLGSARYRPEEVAGAATAAHLPAPFYFTQAQGERILTRLQAQMLMPSGSEPPACSQSQ